MNIFDWQLNFGFDGFVMHGNHVLIKKALLLQSSFLFGTCPLSSLAFGLVTIISHSFQSNKLKEHIGRLCFLSDQYQFHNDSICLLQHLCFLWRLDITSKVYKQRSTGGMRMIRLKKKAMKRVKLPSERKNMGVFPFLEALAAVPSKRRNFEIKNLIIFLKINFGYFYSLAFNFNSISISRSRCFLAVWYNSMVHF